RQRWGPHSRLPGGKRRRPRLPAALVAPREPAVPGRLEQRQSDRHRLRRRCLARSRPERFIDAQFNPAPPAVGAAAPQVPQAWRNKERPPGCGLGFELVLVTPLLAWLAWRRRTVV